LAGGYIGPLAGAGLDSTKKTPVIAYYNNDATFKFVKKLYPTADSYDDEVAACSLSHDPSNYYNGGGWSAIGMFKNQHIIFLINLATGNLDSSKTF
jgi:hypothetical protein